MSTLRERLLSVGLQYQEFLDCHLDGPGPFGPDFPHYKDLPPLTPEQMETFIDVVGKENVKFMSLARSWRGVRGQMMLSKAGKANLDAYLSEGVVTP